MVIDAAGHAGTLQLDAVIGHALARGASVRLVADDRQLARVSAGGVLRDIAHRHGATTVLAPATTWPPPSTSAPAGTG